jgi:hypothetical protein
MEDEDLMGMGLPPEEGEMMEEPMMEEPTVDGMPMEEAPSMFDPAIAQANYGAMPVDKQNMVDLLLRSPVAPIIDELLGEPVMATIAGTMQDAEPAAEEQMMPVEGEGMMAPAPMEDEEAPAPLV